MENRVPGEVVIENRVTDDNVMENGRTDDVEDSVDTARSGKRIIYGINDVPPWPVIILYAIQVRKSYGRGKESSRTVPAVRHTSNDVIYYRTQSMNLPVLG